MTKQKEYIKIAVIILNCVLLFFMIYTIAGSAAYTVLSADDFTSGVRVGVFHAGFFRYFTASLHYVKELYLDWQGTYFGVFLAAFLSPINNFGLPQLRIEMILNALLFFAALFGMIWTAAGTLIPGKENHAMRLTLYTVILFAVLDAGVFPEAFFWFTGAMVYTIPFSFALLGVMCLLMLNNDCYTNRNKNLLTLFSAVLLFLAAGGSLAVSGTACYAALIVGGGLPTAEDFDQKGYRIYNWRYRRCYQCGGARKLCAA